jgi:membrane protease YdiL (CAAX protease family)
MQRALSASAPALLLAGLAAALGVRVALGLPDVAASEAGAIGFVAAAVLVTAAYGWKPERLSLESLLVGAAGGAVLLVGPLWLHLSAPWVEPPLPISSFPVWALTVVLVAGSEEVLLRGALFDACLTLAGPAAAVVVTSMAFAVIHVPLYGVAALPLDLAVGMWLGSLRLLSGSVAAPATAHILADLVGWWLV